ncbi:5'-nucleotidase, lipoprotein e(P4) family [Suttonella ornithocola]|uniref:Outer membrane protein P4 n=1 Tax=Suttonella ornithocola TaxID=279832 RepID=A0A380MV69_9GAMM|nr:5'-nucleotidase, lipoprotein e(P4) family [Suttonella ornithocola]SUO96455.1 Outer membrane protein P4 [Suttonella ornithocola]
MKKLFPIFISPIVLSACVSNHSNSIDTSTNAKADQATLAVDWMQQSGEYRALAYQAFNTATYAFDHAKVKKGKKKAVSVDLDETMIDNSAYAAWQILNNQAYNSKIWTKWVEAKQAKAIPGAVDFANHVVKNGGEIFYVSNRKTGAEYQPTIENLKALGFPHVNEKTVLLRGDTSSKQARFDQITQQGYQIVVFVGDNLNDFGNETYHKDNAERRAFVDANRNEFGRKYIILPNPIYGGWESGLAKDYSSKSTSERYQIRRQTLEAWQHSVQ